MEQLLICEKDRETGIINEPLKKIIRIRNGAVKLGFNEIFIFVERFIFCTEMFSSRNTAAASETYDHLREFISVRNNMQ